MPQWRRRDSSDIPIATVIFSQEKGCKGGGGGKKQRCFSRPPFFLNGVLPPSLPLQRREKREAPNLSRKSPTLFTQKRTKSNLRRKSSTLISSNLSDPPNYRKLTTLRSAKKEENRAELLSANTHKLSITNNQ